MTAIWISTAMVQSEARKPITNPLQVPDYQQVIPLDKKNSAGEPMSADQFPKEAWVASDAEERGYNIKDMPNLFYGGGFWFVSAKAAAILQAHDLGAGALYPVRVLGKDRSTPLGDGWFCVNFGNRKSAFMIEHAHRTRPQVGGKSPVFATLKDDEFAVSSAALDGPDIWVDPQLWDSIFFSERLGKALKKAKAANGFYLRSCRVID
jgi:hypothetical protein